MFSKKVAEQEDTKHELNQLQKELQAAKAEVESFKGYKELYEREAKSRDELSKRCATLVDDLDKTTTEFSHKLDEVLEEKSQLI